MKPNAYILALIWEDTEHLKDYAVDEAGNCYRKDDLIGTMGKVEASIGQSGVTLDIEYQPIKPVEKIVINISISKHGLKHVKNG